MIYAYYTPYVASPINDKRAGTIRIGWDNPDPIQIVSGYNSDLLFSFRDEKQKRVLLQGRTLRGRVYNHAGIEMFNNELKVSDTDDANAIFSVTKFQSNSLPRGLYSLVLSYTDGAGIEHVANTARSQPRFVLDIIDFSANQ